MRLACARHLRDLEDGPTRGLKWDWAAAEHAIGFFYDVLRLAGGEHEGHPFELHPSQKFIVGSLFGWKAPDGHRRFRVAYIEQGKGNGKALALDTPIPTPSGWTTMGAVQPGDVVFDENGAPCNVTFVTDEMVGRKCYEVVFDDGARIVADAEHLWLTDKRVAGDKSDRARMQRGVQKQDWGKWKIGLRTTQEISDTLRYANGKYQSANHSVALAGALRCPDSELPIEPYALGAWLGDGDSDCARITISEQDIAMVRNLELVGVSVGARKGAPYKTGRYRIGGVGIRGPAGSASLNSKLRCTGLLKNKRIPPQYLRASLSQRLDLLQGLMDTDGTIGKSRECEFTSTKKVLADGVLELILSLGLKARMATGRAMLYGRDVGPKYRITFFAPEALPVFRLQRKLDRQVETHSRRKLSGERRITACDPVPSVPVKCIAVDSPSHLYLAGREMIPTHNTPLAAGIGLYMLMADDEPRAEVYAAAVDKDQAKILFRDAVAMVDQSKALSTRLTRSGGKGKEWNLAYLETGSFFRPVSSEHVGGRGKSGFRPHCALLDEVHEHPGPAMVEFMRAGTKGRRQALILMITNAGVYDPTAVAFHYHDYSEKVLNQHIENDSFFNYVCALDRGDDWKDPSVWRKTNPLLGISVTEKYLQEQVLEAVGMPSKQSLVRRLSFCEWVEAEDPFVEPEVWRANGGHVDEESLAGLECYGGLDLSGKNDLTALSLVFPREDGTKDVLSYFWTPKDTLRQRQDRDRAPYEQWVREGHLIAKDGATIDYGFVAQKLGELRSKYELVALAFDRWRIDDLKRELEDLGIGAWIFGRETDNGGICLVEHGQGYKDMNPAVEALEDDLKEKRLRHGNHPVLGWCVANAKISTDPAGLRKFDKRKTTGRIDGAVSLAMASNLSTYFAMEDTIEYTGLRCVG